MSFRRPTQVPRWAWGGAATLVQPPSGSAEAGFPTRAEPPAQWFNWIFNAQGAWIDFLRGPDVEKWDRAVWPGTPASDHFDAPGALAFDVDTVTSDAGETTAAFRFAVVGETSAPAAKMFVSQRGNQWAARTNLPSGVTGPFALKALSSSTWLLGCLESGGAASIYYASSDDGTAAGPLGANGNSWSAASVPGSMAEVKAFAELGGAAKLVAACASSTFAVNSDDGGATWTASTFGTTPSNNGLDVVSDGVKYVWVSQDGEIYNSTDGVNFAATVSLAPGASASWRLCAGAPGEVLAYRIGGSTSLDLYLSADSGASWTAVTQPAGSPVYITRVAYRDGVWMATSSRSPWLWVSNDLTSWRALSPPVDTSASPAALYNVRFDGGSWVAVGNGFALSCGRAADPAAGAYVASDAPATLSDAGSLRGRRIATTTPTTGQVLVYNSTSGEWEPGSAGSASPTTTRGDLIRRGASADERLPAATADTFVGGDGTDVTTRTAAQVRTSLSLPPALTLPATSRVFALLADSLSGAHGDPVSAWTDGSWSATASGSARPTLVTASRGIGGRPCVRFDGSDDLLTIAHAAGLDVSTISLYVVCRARRDSSDALPSLRWLVTRPYDSSNSSPYSEVGIFQTSGTAVAARVDGTEYTAGSLKGIADWAQPAVWCLSVGAGGTALHANGRRQLSGAATSVTYDNSEPLGIGGRPTATPAEWFRGDIAAVVLYSAAHTSAERAEVEAYLASHYNLPLVSGDT